MSSIKSQIEDFNRALARLPVWVYALILLITTFSCVYAVIFIAGLLTPIHFPASPYRVFCACLLLLAGAYLWSHLRYLTRSGDSAARLRLRISIAIVAMGIVALPLLAWYNWNLRQI